MMKVLAVVTNQENYVGHMTKTGLWLSELTHFLDVLAQHQFSVDLASITGKQVWIDPMSLSKGILDRSTKNYLENSEFMRQLNHLPPLETCQLQSYEAIYFAGGHGTMYDFVDNQAVANAIVEMNENGKTISAVCHGVGALLDVVLPDGTLFLSSHKVTGFSNVEEWLVRKQKLIPFSLENRLKQQAASYHKAFIPYIPYVVCDGELLTGQNPQSTKRLANALVTHLLKKKKKGG